MHLHYTNQREYPVPNKEPFLLYTCSYDGLSHSVANTRLELTACGMDIGGKNPRDLHPVTEDTVYTCIGCATAPWLQEPLRADFQHEGFDCEMFRSSRSCWVCVAHLPHVVSKLSPNIYSSVEFVDAMLRRTGRRVFINTLPNPWRPVERDYFEVFFVCDQTEDAIPGFPKELGNPGEYRTYQWAKNRLCRVVDHMIVFLGGIDAVNSVRTPGC